MRVMRLAQANGFGGTAWSSDLTHPVWLFLGDKEQTISVGR